MVNRVFSPRQGLTAFQHAFGADAAAVSGSNAQKNARVLIATYQTLDIDSDEADADFLETNCPADYFSRIIIDECHRNARGEWSKVLTRNPNAVQIGLTATPRQLDYGKLQHAETDAAISADNIRHFGEPVYEYDIGQGIEDGYLAACEDRSPRHLPRRQPVRRARDRARSGRPVEHDRRGHRDRRTPDRSRDAGALRGGIVRGQAPAARPR